MKEKISIIIPVYNTKAYLKKCIDSVLNQTYENLEVICVDDGSTDGSGEILDAYAKQDARIRVIHKANAGVSAARNDGLKIATGDWIGFVDSDDYIAEEMYETMLGANQGKRADILTCSYFFDDKGLCCPAENKRDVPMEVVDTKDFLIYIYERDVYKAVGGYLWSRLFQRELILDRLGKADISFPEEYGVGEDIIFLAQVLMNSSKSLYVDKPLYYYVQREGSAVHDERKQLESLSWAKAYLQVLELYRQEEISEDVYNIIARMFVFRCGRLAEVAIQYHQRDKYDELKEMILMYKPIYEQTNKNYPERSEWIKEILNYEWN